MAAGPDIQAYDRLHDDLPTQGTRSYAIIVCVFASLGGLFFGYGQGSSGERGVTGVLAMRSFEDDYCTGWNNFTSEQCSNPKLTSAHEWLSFTLWYDMAYHLGCMLGAFAGGIVADKRGRRATIFQASVLYCVGTCWVCFCPSMNHGMLQAARFVQGMGVGNVSFSLPLYGSECAPKELRGMLAGFMQMTIVTGLLAANIVNECVKNTANGWRVAIGVAMIAPVIVMAGIFCVPESPRWTYQHEGKHEAEAVLKRLRQTENVGRELDAIGDRLAEQGGEFKYSDLLEPSILRRVILACLLQLLQQATGINPMFTFGGLVFTDITNNGVMSVLLLSIVNFASTFPAMHWVDSFGRRQLLLMGSVGMVLGHLLSAVVFSATCNGNTLESGCAGVGGWVIVLSTAFFIFNFAISWGPVCWIYPSEIFPLKVRATAVSFSTMANWLMEIVITYVAKIFPDLNINGVFFLFAGTCCISGVFVYFMCPETSGIQLEDVEELFRTSSTMECIADGYQAPSVYAQPPSNQRWECMHQRLNLVDEKLETLLRKQSQGTTDSEELRKDIELYKQIKHRLRQELLENADRL